ncbi:hypothetical protein ABZ345_07125 [Lentzea sp. NPDC005914]
MTWPMQATCRILARLLVNAGDRFVTMLVSDRNHGRRGGPAPR